MTLIIYGIRDTKADAYTRPPFFLSTEGQALRAFIDLAKTPDSDVGMHPEDYGLYELGSFDQATGEIQALPNPKFILSASAAATINAVPLRKVE